MNPLLTRSLSNEEKDTVLKIVASELPYEKRFLFYLAFQPRLYDEYCSRFESAEAEAQRIFEGEKRLSDGRVNMVLDEVTLADLKPQHFISTDIGMGSSSYRNRANEIEKGMLIPLTILHLRGYGNIIYEGQARAVAAFERGMEIYPAFVITPRDASMDRIANYTRIEMQTGLSNLADMILPQLSLPHVVTIEGANIPVIAVRESKDLQSIAGTAIMKSIVDTVREKRVANIFVSDMDLKFLRTAAHSNVQFPQYLENWDSVRVFFKISKDATEEEKADIIAQLEVSMPGNIKRENIYIASSQQELLEITSEQGGIDVVLSDVHTFNTDAEIISEVTGAGTKTLLFIPTLSDGNLFQEMFLKEEPAVLMDILNNPDNLLVALGLSIRSLLPQETRPQSPVVQLDNSAEVEEQLAEIIAEINLAVEQARGFNHPALVAVSGGLGVGQNTLIEMLTGSKHSSVATLNIDDFRLTSDDYREPIKQDISMQDIGTLYWLNNGIGIRREDADNITVKTSFDEVTMVLPAVGREIQVPDHFIFIRRIDENTISIRLSAAISNIALGRFYQAVQNLREGEPAYVPLHIDGEKVSIRTDTPGAIEAMLKDRGPAQNIEGRNFLSMPAREGWSLAKPGCSFWVDISSGGVFYRLDPENYELIFVSGEFTLHQESINPLYNLALYVDADFSIRIERLIRAHIFEGRYPEMTASQLREYLNTQSTVEDQLLFTEAECADYIITNSMKSDELLLQQFYGKNLSERVETAIDVAQRDGLDSAWDILENYVVPVLSAESVFRTVLEDLIIYNESETQDFSRDSVDGLLARIERTESVTLEREQKELLYKILADLGLI